MRRLCAALVALFGFALAAEAEPPPSAQQELSAAIDILKAHHINRAAADWSQIEAQASAAVKDAKSAPDAYPAIWLVIRRLNVRHTFLITADQFQAMTTGQKVGEAAPPKPDMPDARLAAPGVALIHLPWFQGDQTANRAYVAAARTALNGYAVQHVCRYIVDLRGNVGGDMHPMMNAVRGLLGSQPYGYWDFGSDPIAWEIQNAPVNWNPGPPFTDYSEPATPVKHARIAVLVDRNTGSSGEFTAIAFEGLPNAKVFGEPSGGLVTTNAPYALPDGARLMVSTGWSMDRAKRPYRVKVVPDENTAPGRLTVDAALRWLKSQRCR